MPPVESVSTLAPPAELLVVASDSSRPAPHGNFRSVAANTAWLCLQHFVRLGAGIIVGAWLARFLGPEQFGLYSYALAFVALFSPLAMLGLDSVIIRDIVRDPRGTYETLGTSFLLRLVSSAIVIGLIVTVAPLDRPGDIISRQLIPIIALTILIQPFDLIDLWFQSQVQSRYAVLAKNVAFAFGACLRVALIHLHYPLAAFAWVCVIETAIAVLGLVIAYRIRGQPLTRWHASLYRAKTLLSDSWLFLLSHTTVLIYLKIDQVLLLKMAAPEAVGIYSAATRISEAGYFIPVAIVASVFPSIVRNKQIDERLYKQRLQKLLTLLVGISILIALPLTFLSTNLVVLLFGERYAAAGPVLAVHTWAGIFVFLLEAQWAWDVTEGLGKLSLYRSAGGAVINIGLNLLLIPRFSCFGSAIATIVAYAWAGLLVNAISPKTQGLFIIQVKALFLGPALLMSSIQALRERIDRTGV